MSNTLSVRLSLVDHLFDSDHHHLSQLLQDTSFVYNDPEYSLLQHDGLGMMLLAPYDFKYIFKYNKKACREYMAYAFYSWQNKQIAYKEYMVYQSNIYCS